MFALPRSRRAAALLLALALLAPARAGAHMAGVSHLKLEIAGPGITGTWDVHVHDARVAMGWPAAATPDSGWAELKAHEPEFRKMLASKLTLATDGKPCPFAFTAEPMTLDRTIGAAVLHLTARADTSFSKLRIGFDLLLWDVDPTYTGFFSVQDERVTTLGVFKHGGAHSLEIDIHHTNWARTIAEFVREGISHIWSGPDHILFLLALLLPAALRREQKRWEPRAGFWPALREVVKVVTAFTCAHSLTLALSFFGILRLPVEITESAIAVSVFVAAWNNLHPFLPGKACVMAATFGLVHGLGFANALAQLGAPPHLRALALGSFNVGVEIGQLVIVGVALPVLYAASRRQFYPRLVMGVGSFAICWVAVLWFLERGFDLQIFPGR